MVISDGVPAVPRNRKLSEFRSLPRNRKQLEILFRGNSRNAVPNHSAEEKQLRTKRDSRKCRKKFQKRRLLRYGQIILLSYFVFFVKLIFSADGIGSSAELGIPRNEHFLPRKIGNLASEFVRNEIPFPTLVMWTSFTV